MRALSQNISKFWVLQQHLLPTILGIMAEFDLFLDLDLSGFLYRADILDYTSGSPTTVLVDDSIKSIAATAALCATVNKFFCNLIIWALAYSCGNDNADNSKTFSISAIMCTRAWHSEKRQSRLFCFPYDDSA